jgi:cytochrome c
LVSSPVRGGKRRAGYSALWFALVVAGCVGDRGGSAPGQGTAAAPAAGHALRDGASPAQIERGELLSLACRACHTLAAGEADGTGPNLYGVFDRRAGSRPGFDYSPALRAAALVWSAQALDAWLANPTGFIPGTTMGFTGYRSESDRRDLIAYLMEATAAPASQGP